jgi:putative membrane protein
MKKVFLAGSVALIVLASCKKDKNNENVSSTDQTFLTQAAISNKSEIMAGQLAATKSTTASIKSFGQLMVTEHTQAQTDLQGVYSGASQTMPDTLDAQHRVLMTRLNSLSGHSFDSAYISSQVMDHQAAVTLFQNEISNGNNSSVKSYASTYLPHIQMHLQKADSLSRAQ